MFVIVKNVTSHIVTAVIVSGIVITMLHMAIKVMDGDRAAPDVLECDAIHIPKSRDYATEKYFDDCRRFARELQPLFDGGYDSCEYPSSPRLPLQ